MALTDEAVRDELRRIILSPGFVHSERLRRFLSYSVEQTLAGNPQNLKEYAIGVEAFDRPRHYSPSEDPIVRVEARRLRKKLDEYYAAAGANNPVRIDLPKGSYVPVFIGRAGRKKWLPSAAAATVLTCAAVVWILWMGRSTSSRHALSLARLTSDAGLATDPALSSDGRWLAYASDRGGSNLNIWIRQLGDAGGDARRVTTSTVDHHQPALSPHGDSIAFRSEAEPSGVYTMPVSGGEQHLFAKDGRDPQYSSDGAFIAYWIGSPGDDLLPPSGRIFIRASGANAAAATPLAAHMNSAACPVWSPDGSRVLFLGSNSSNGKADWWTTAASGAGVPVATGAADMLAQNGLALPFRECTASWQSDWLIFAARGGDTQNLWRLPLDSSGRAHSPIERLTFGSATEWKPAANAAGTIVFSSRTSHSRIFTLAGKELTPVAATSSEVTFPSASQDGHAIAFLGESAGASQIWLKRLDTGQETALTEAPIKPRYPQISPDGTAVAFTDQASHKVYSVSAASRHLQALPIPADSRIWDWTGHLLLYQVPDARHQFEEFDQRTGLSRTLIKAAFDLAGPRLSSDLRSIAWHGIPSASRRQVFHSGYPLGKSSPTPLTDADSMNRNCAWSPDSRTLYFLSERDGHRCIWKHAASGDATPVAVRHFHSTKQSMAAFGDVGAIGLSATSAGLAFALSDSESNLWMMQRQR